MVSSVIKAVVRPLHGTCLIKMRRKKPVILGQGTVCAIICILQNGLQMIIAQAVDTIFILFSSRQEALEGSHIIRYMYCFVGNFWTLSFFVSTIGYIVQEYCRGLTTEFLDCWEFANLNIQGRRVNGHQTSILAT